MVLQTSTAIWTHMVVIPDIMTTQPNLGSFQSVFASEGETGSEFGSLSHSLANLWWLAAKAKKIDSGWSKRQNNERRESQKGAQPYSGDAWHAHWSLWGKYTKQALIKILCIHNQVQSSDRDWYQNSINSWTQTWLNKYSLDCPSSISWNQLDSGRVKCTIFSLKLCNFRLFKSPFHEWAVLGEMEKITQFITCPVITALHIEEGWAV